MSNWNQQPPPGWNNQQQGSFTNPAYQQPYGYAAPRTMDASVDGGLRAFMLSVYNWMALGLVISGAIAYFVATQSFGVDPVTGRRGLTAIGRTLFGGPMMFVVIFAPLVMIFAYSFLQSRMSPAAAKLFYIAFVALMGVSLATVFFVYRIGSIAQVFFMTAAAFGALSLWGYTTKRDLSAMGTFLIMGLFGIVLAGIVNIFLQSSALQFAISCIGIVVFAGLTAWDTQRLKESYYDQLDAGEVQKMAVDGALSLYLNFINLFQFMLSLFGQRND